MRKIGLMIVAAAGLFCTAAYAQGVGVEIDGPGVRVERGYHDGWDRDRRWQRSYNEYRGDDRRDTVVVRRHRDWDRPHRKIIIDRDD